MSKVKLGYCPFCNSTEYTEEVSEFVTGYNCPYVVMDCYCKDCDKQFTTYYSQDEVKFYLEDEEKIYNNSLSKEEKEILLNAMDLLVEKTQDTIDYTRIYNILNGELNEE